MSLSVKGSVLLCFIYTFVLVLHFKPKTINFEFSGKIATSLAHNFLWKKPYSKLFSGLIFFSEPIFKNFCSKCFDSCNAYEWHNHILPIMLQKVRDKS